MSKFEVDDRTDAALADIERAIEAGLKSAASYAETKIIDSMPSNPLVEGGEGGWKKSFGNRMKSIPGEPPMQQTGVLAGNIISGKMERLKYAVGTKAGYSKAPYGMYLDRGTSKMAARPWLGTIFRSRKKQLNDEFKRGFERAIKRDF